MELLIPTIEHKLKERFPGRSIRCLPEIDPISFTAFYRLIFEGRKTSFTIQPKVLIESARQQFKDVDQIADEWVASIHGLEQMLLQNEIKL